MLRVSLFVSLFLCLAGCEYPKSVDKNTACQGMQDSCLLAEDVDNEELDQVCNNVDGTCKNADEACEQAPETCDSADAYCAFATTLDERVQAACNGLTSSCAALQAACGNSVDAGSGDGGAQVSAE